MKFCLSSRVNPNLLAKADEIKFDFRDRKAIPDFYEKYPQADIILYCPYDTILDWDNLKELNILSRGKLILAVSHIADMIRAKELGFRTFYGFPVQSLYELRSLALWEPEYVKIGIPLFFEMDNVKSFNVPVRAVPNVAYNDGMTRSDGVCGQWIRPEDLESMYGEYIAAVEFEGVDADKEAVLYKVYAVDKKWDHGLDLIIINLNYVCQNRMILSEQIQKRLNCGHRCMMGKCNICYRVFNMADPVKIETYMEEVYPDGLPN